MSFETFLTVVCIVLLVACSVGYRHSFKHVYLKYKDQKVGGRTKQWKK